MAAKATPAAATRPYTFFDIDIDGKRGRPGGRGATRGQRSSAADGPLVAAGCPQRAA